MDESVGWKDMTQTVEGEGRLTSALLVWEDVGKTNGGGSWIHGYIKSVSAKSQNWITQVWSFASSFRVITWIFVLSCTVMPNGVEASPEHYHTMFPLHIVGFHFSQSIYFSLSAKLFCDKWCFFMHKLEIHIIHMWLESNLMRQLELCMTEIDSCLNCYKLLRSLLLMQGRCLLQKYWLKQSHSTLLQ